ncbi:MAG: amino acid adenylation domain-containing protein [Desulfovibrio sp.]
MQKSFVTPLTHAEKRIYITQELYPESTMWCIPFTLRFALVDIGRLYEALVQTIKETPGLHVKFRKNGEDVEKYLDENTTPHIQILDFAKKGEQGFMDWVREDYKHPLELFNEYPYRFVLADVGDGISYFYMNIHHIAIDGGGVNLLHHRVIEAYEALSNNSTVSFPSSPAINAAYESEQKYLSSKQFAEDKNYWNTLFEQVPDPLDLSGTPASSSLNISDYSHNFSSNTSRALRSYCRTNKISPFRVVLASMSIVLARTLRRSDVVLGTATANRHPAELKDALGMFVNSCAILMNVENGATFRELTQQVSSQIRNIVKHERYPYDILASDLRNKTGQVPDLVSYSLVEMVRTPFPDYVKPVFIKQEEAIAALTGFLEFPRPTDPESSRTTLKFQYNTEMFEDWRIEALSKHIEQALIEGISHPESSIGSLNFLTETEQRQLIYDFNDTKAEWDIETTLIDCINECTRLFPGHTAVVYRGKSITYAELDAKANAMARSLRKLGAGPDTIIGLLADRSVDIIVAQIAILKSGSAFMPIDSEYPDSRIQFMLEDINAPMILTQSRFIEERDFGSAVIANMDNPAIYAEDNSPIDNPNTPHDLCAVIYTSGSTGNPKGVMLEHRSICNSIRANIRDQKITSEDNLSKYVSFSFDPSMLEIFSALMSGATVHVIPEEIRLSLGQLNEYYEANNITWACLPTQVGEQFIDFFDNRSLKTLVIGGEKMRIFTKRNYNIINQYGPTECSIYASQHEVTQFEENIPIGKPIANFRISILDNNDNLQPAGYGGELCIGGPGVARGYHNREDKNAECFIADPLHDGETLYRTGDLACWNPDGTISHLGRMDRQVKLRGFRIELGEIEKAMLSIEGINEAAVGDFKDSSGHVYLCGYFCGNTDPDAVTTFLNGAIPPFMVPAYMLKLDKMPISLNGKIDRNKLPEPKATTTDEVEYIPPTTELETSLCTIWGKSLDREEVSVEADFFKSGGDSLRAVNLQLTITRELKKEIPLGAIFEFPTPRKMAAHLNNTENDVQISVAEQSEFYPTTVSQQHLFLLSRMKGIGTAYNMPLCIAFDGKLNRKCLSESLLALVKRHESLRTAFEVQDGKCVQKIVDDVHLKLDFAQTDKDDPKELTRGFSQVFDLSRPPLMHAKLIANEDGRHWLLLDFHHIVFDGVSVGIFLRELFALYEGKELAALPIQQKDVATWETVNAEKIQEKHESFWQELFHNPPEADFPTDFPRPAHQNFEGATYRHQISPEATTALRSLAQKSGSTLYQIFMAATGILASRWSDCEDVCIGTSMSGRDHAGTAGIVGMFVRTLPTRIRPENDKSFSTLLTETAQQIREIHEHGDYPISGLYEYLGANRGPGRHPMFDINFVMRNIGADNSFALDNLRAEIGSHHSGTAKFDISIACEEHETGLVLEIDYRTSLYRRETITRMAGHLCSILTEVTKNDDIAIGAIDILGRDERFSLLNHFNPSPAPAPKWPTVCQAIEEQAKQHPDNIAVVAEDGSLTYKELNTLANKAAHSIARSGGGKDRIVAVVAARSIWSVAGMLAALKSGSAYVGLDTHYPPERIKFILEDTDAPCVVGSKAQLAEIECSCAAIALDGNLQQNTENPELATGGNALAYCIFTSGSTGVPKGVLIEHHSMVNFINWYASHHNMTPESTCAAFAAFSFDVSVVQVFAPLVSGSTLHVIPEDLRRSPNDLEAYFVENKVTHAHFPTQFAEQYMRMCDMDSLKYLVVGGDALKSYRLGNFRLTNEYGPSETTMACLSYDVPDILPKPSIGSPVANTRIYILDSKDRLCPIGVPGEICVAGTQVGRGYLNRPELTEKFFVQDIFNPEERMFRTGDKGVWLEDGTVDFIGRMDFQVKIRGYRVEPGEIEARIKEIENILETVVVPLEDPNGNKVLAAYYTGTTQLDADTIKTLLKDQIPEYMVPAHLVQLEKLPLNPNGKIDRSKLPRPEITSSAVGPLEPRNPKEARIAQAWENVLGHRGFGLYDSFYDIGGDSLSAIALLADLSETFDISASDLFSYTTIAEQADHFQEAEIGRSARLLKLKNLVNPPEEDALFKQEVTEYEIACQGDENLDTDTTQELNHVLLTGATGTLGIYLLRELLSETQTHITAVVRAKTDEAAYRRLAEHYRERFDKELKVDAKNRLDVIVGDLAVAGFDLDKSQYTKLEDEVDSILHSAALTSHYGDWNDFVSANITSVENLAEFARKGRAKAMHHISTTSIGAGQIEGRTQALFTEFDVDMGQVAGNLYVRSKLLAEVALEKLRKEGLPVNVYRAGNVTCDSETGAFQRNVDDNAFYQQIRAYVNLGVAPDKTDVRNMSYVDQSAKAIVTAMMRPGLAGQTFHIHNPKLLSLSEALEDSALGLQLKRISFDEFIEFFSGHAGCIGFDQYVERILMHLGWQDWLSDPAKTGTVIRTERSASLLERCGFTWKTPTPEDLRFFVKHALQDRATLLKDIPGFSALNENALIDIAARIQPEYFGDSYLLQQEKAPVDGIRFVIEGMVETYRHNASGWVGTVRVGGSGACMGEEAALDNHPAINSVESLGETYTFMLTPEDFRSLTMQHPELGLALLKISSMKTDQAERLFVAM